MKNQYILGINGWAVRSHDASATLIKCSDNNVEIIAAAEEERFTRKLHAYDSLPINAVKFCLEQGKILPEELSTVALSWNMPLQYAKRNINFEFEKKDFLNRLFNQNIRKMPNFEFVNHHLAHALSTYSPSGFDSAAILVIDGQGESSSTTVWSANKNVIDKLDDSKIQSSLGYFYEALTEFIGFRSDQAGKTMGLAPYGNSEEFFKPLKSLFSVDDTVIDIRKNVKIEYGKLLNNVYLDEQEQLRTFWFEEFKRITGLNPNDKNKKYSFRHFPEEYLNLAASGQKVLEQVIVQLAKNVSEKTKQNNLCLAGGVALNCVANGRIIQDLGLNIYIQPAANDAGSSLGAALAIAKDEGYKFFNVKMSPYLGKEYSNAEILNVLRNSGVHFEKSSDMFKVLSDEILKENVVGLFQGRFEFGPRALGNRSFVANPNIVNLFDYINKEIKAREEGRPLAASIIIEDVLDLFGEKVYGPHMNITHNLNCSSLKAVQHVDGSIRPQILSYEDNPLFYNQIKEVGKAIGVNALINTSLNFQEPIVTSPQEALALFKKTSVDSIIFNNKYIAYRDK